MEEVRFFLFFAGANADSGKVDAGDSTNEAGLSQEGRRVSVDTTMSKTFERVKALLSGDIVMAYFDPHRKTRPKTDAVPEGIAVTMKQYDPESKRWRPVTYRLFTRGWAYNREGDHERRRGGVIVGILRYIT